MTKSLSIIWTLTLIGITIYILYKNKQITLTGINYLINYIKTNLKKIYSDPPPPEEEDNIKFGNDYLDNLLPFDIVKAPTNKRRRIEIPTWGVWAIAKGSTLVKEPLTKFISSSHNKESEESCDPDHPLWNPYNDTKLIKSILNELENLKK